MTRAITELSFRQRLQRAAVRVITALLVFILVVLVYLVFSPNALETVFGWFSPPGVVSIPAFGERPAPPQIDVPAGQPPSGPLALSGIYEGGYLACGFLLELASGQAVGVSTAHASPFLSPKMEAAFLAADGSLVARASQLERGRPFREERFAMDYALWRVAEINENMPVLQPDPRVLAQEGERVRLYDPFRGDAGQSAYYTGVVMKAGPEAIWVQMDDSFAPQGFSGCPLVSEHTGRVIGMAVAGEDLSPALIGAHPIASIVEKAINALK